MMETDDIIEELLGVDAELQDVQGGSLFRQPCFLTNRTFPFPY